MATIQGGQEWPHMSFWGRKKNEKTFSSEMNESQLELYWSCTTTYRWSLESQYHWIASFVGKEKQRSTIEKMGWRFKENFSLWKGEGRQKSTNLKNLMETNLVTGRTSHPVYCATAGNLIMTGIMKMKKKTNATDSYDLWTAYVSLRLTLLRELFR